MRKSSAGWDGTQTDAGGTLSCAHGGGGQRCAAVDGFAPSMHARRRGLGCTQEGLACCPVKGRSAKTATPAGGGERTGAQGGPAGERRQQQAALPTRCRRCRPQRTPHLVGARVAPVAALLGPVRVPQRHGRVPAGRHSSVAWHGMMVGWIGWRAAARSGARRRSSMHSPLSPPKSTLPLPLTTSSGARRRCGARAARWAR